jgi:hypothetical protein
MATQDDVRRIALALPHVTEDEGRFAFGVHGKGFCWIYLERVHPKKARVPNPEGLAITITGEEEKAILIASDPEVYFTTDHYNGYPAILVWLPRISIDALEDLLVDAWHLKAPKALHAEFVAPER